MKDYLIGMKDAIREEMECNANDWEDALQENKVVVTILKGGDINAKEIKVISTRKKLVRNKLTQEDIEKIKNAKKILKNKLDVVYLYTLLIRVKEVAEKVDINNLEPESVSLIKDAYQSILKPLRQIEQK